MSTKLTITSYLRTDTNMQDPAPNVSETAYIANILKQDTTPIVTDLTAAPLTVLTDHRGALLYCVGCVTVYRYNSTTRGGICYSSMPSAGAEEQLFITCNTGWYVGVARFD